MLVQSSRSPSTAPSRNRDAGARFGCSDPATYIGMFESTKTFTSPHARSRSPTLDLGQHVVDVSRGGTEPLQCREWIVRERGSALFEAFFDGAADPLAHRDLLTIGGLPESAVEFLGNQDLKSVTHMCIYTYEWLYVNLHPRGGGPSPSGPFTHPNALRSFPTCRSLKSNMGAPLPTFLRYGPYRMFTYSSDGDEPPHVHVVRDGWEAKFWMAPVRPAYSKGFDAPELRRIHRIIQ